MSGQDLMKSIQAERNFSDFMYSECMKMKNQRDEARRLYCQTMADSLKHYRSAEQIAEDRGWDCFKENINETWSAGKHDAIARQIKDTVNEITENTRKAVPQKIDLFKENTNAR